MKLALEPGVFDRRVPGDEVQQDPHAAASRLRDQFDHVLVGAVARRDREEVGHVVPRVDEGRCEAGVEPQCVDAERGDVVKVCDHSLEVADAVPVGVRERLRVDLVEHCVVQPVRPHGCAAPSGGRCRLLGGPAPCSRGTWIAREQVHR